MLKRHCAWVRDHVIKNPNTGRYEFKVRATWSDESFLHANSFRLSSWVYGKDNICDIGPQGEGSLITLLDTIFSWRMSPDSVRVSWQPHRKTGEYNGPTDADTIRKYFGDRVFPIAGQVDAAAANKPVQPLAGMAGVINFVDNAGCHKAFEESLVGMKAEDIMGWVCDEGEAEDAANAQMLWDQRLNFLTQKEARKELMEWVKENNMRTRKLQNAAKMFNQLIWYLPPYHPETNPIEFVWAYVKRKFRDQPLPLTWEVRLQRAYALVTHEFVNKCIDRSVRWCLATDAAFRGIGRTNRAALLVVHEDDED